MPAPSVDAVLAQAATFTEQLVDAYEVQIAAGEVGGQGSARASDEPILGNRPPTALMYGRVQSGKTAAMTLTTALALDNGFRVIIVLTADSLALVTQTANRFKAVDGPRVFSTVTDDVYEWEGQEQEIAADLPRDGIILVCAKDAFHLPRVIEFLAQINASSYPAIVFDDEADAATPDTTLAARSAGRANAPAVPSTINRRVIENNAPGEEGESINEILPHGIYVQVTATPYLLFLQRENARIRPNLVFLLEPGAGYSGGETFFAPFDPNADRTPPPIVPVAGNELQVLQAAQRRRTPAGLAASIDFFLVAAATRAQTGDGWPVGGFKHLSHTSLRINQHTVVSAHIERHLTQRRRELRDDPQNAATRVFAAAHGELTRTFAAAPGLDVLGPVIYDAIRQAEVIRVNSNTDVPIFGPRLNFMIGGNILGRGLTIDDLLVTYYLREAQTPQMDTVWQHARMYGYRGPLMPFTRVYTPGRLAALFRSIHESEEQLRELLRRVVAGEDVPVRIAPTSRATRRNATEPGVLRIYNAGIDQITPRFVENDPGVASQVRQGLIDLGVPIEREGRNARTTTAAMEGVLEIVDLVPIRDGDQGRWQPGAVRSLMEAYRTAYNDRVPVYVRGLQAEVPPPEGWVRGRLSGDEIGIIRAAANGVPAVALLYLGPAENPTGWYPTLVMPANSANYIVNPL
jgi:hypothetical protein